MKSVELITFDLGGTLLSPFPTVGEAYAEELEDLGYICDPTRLQSRFDSAIQDWMQYHGQGNSRDDRESWLSIVRTTIAEENIPEDSFARVFEQLYEAFAHASRWSNHDGTRDAIETLTARGVRLAVASNNDTRARQVLKEHQLIDFFEALFLSGEIGFEKPDERFFAHISEVTRVPPENILHIGDSPRHDFDGARNAGMQAYIVSTFGHSLNDFIEQF